MAYLQLIVPLMIMGTIGVFVEDLPIPSMTVVLCRVALAAISIGIYLLLNELSTTHNPSFSKPK